MSEDWKNQEAVGRIRLTFPAGLIGKALDAPGLPLDPQIRALLENRFGREFTAVRVHSDAAAAAAAEAICASAFTVGSHIVFSQGRYEPETRKGLWLLAHELAHVVQQEAGLGFAPIGATDVFALERAADLAADTVAQGDALPAAFAFGTAPYGAVLRHIDKTFPQCPGTPIDAGDELIWRAANQAIESKYKGATGHQEDAILVGSDFERIQQIALPRGAPNSRFGNLLLQELRGLVNQNKPDIVDFRNRKFYEIKTLTYAAQGFNQVSDLYRKTEEIRRKYAWDTEPPWVQDHENWYPPHVIEFPLDLTIPATLGKIVCTQATDYTRWPGLILYDVREITSRRRRQQPAVRYELQAFEPNYMEFARLFRAQLPKTVRFFDPDSPDYVIIVPREFFTLDLVRLKARKEWESIRMKLPYFADTRNEEVLENRINWTIIMVLVAGGAAPVTAEAFAGVAVAAAPEVGTGVGTVVVAEAGAETGGIEVVVASRAGAASLQSTIIAPPAVVSEVSAASATALLAQFATPAVKAATALAGAVLVIGNAKKVWASPVGDVTIDPDRFVAMRAVPINDFTAVAGVQTGYSTGMSNDVCLSREAIKKNFGLGTKVLYDNVAHFIMGWLTVT